MPFDPTSGDAQLLSIFDSDYYEISEVDGRLAFVSPNEEMVGPHAVRILEAINMVRKSVQVSGHFLYSLPDIVMSCLLQDGPDGWDDGLSLLRTLMYASSLTYEDRGIELGVVVVNTAQSSVLEEYFRTRSVHFVPTGPVRFDTAFLAQSKHNFSPVDGLSLAYVVSTKSELCGVLVKAYDKDIRSELFPTIVEPQTPMGLSYLWSSIAQNLREHLNELPGIFALLLSEPLVVAGATEVEDSVRATWVQVTPTKVRLYLDDLAYLEWTGGGWRLHDRSRMYSELLGVLFAGESVVKDNPVPFIDLLLSKAKIGQIDRNAALFEQFGQAFISDESVQNIAIKVMTEGGKFMGLYLSRVREFIGEETFVKLLTTARESLSKIPGASTAMRILEDVMSVELISADCDLNMVLSAGMKFMELANMLSTRHRGALLVCVPRGVDEQTVVSELFGGRRPESVLDRAMFGDQHKALELDKFVMARLAELDGATVLDSCAGTLSFGGIITYNPPATLPASEGSRSLAALRASLNPNVWFSVKISQDGPISLFVNGRRVFEC